MNNKGSDYIWKLMILKEKQSTKSLWQFKINIHFIQLYSSVNSTQEQFPIKAWLRFTSNYDT